MIALQDHGAPPMVLAMPAAGLAERATGPRPNRDPAAVPAGMPPEEATSLSANLSVVSDYVFRGVSQSDGDPAIQASVEVAAPSGFYAGTFASNSTAYDGADVEVDLYGGYRFDLAGIGLDAGVISYLYPGARQSSSIELHATGGIAVATGEIRAGISYAPEQVALGAGDGLYLFAETEMAVPRTPLTLRGHVGRERGVNVGEGSKVDWLIAADVAQEPLTLSIAWVGATYGDPADGEHVGKIVGSVSLDF
ncbi:uncharacterized protein (TIGR02001 family) [Sphingomonas jejuensis]|uniref:Uncharacterized protein (TIGR02001 family) n=1 Tax=Sphingomonas jejuensis TaxID=904715 RepID=A0ABX0XIX6_9SPHN|nr:TorF family putative porin [Sphingomonas jejuensis]NJC32690.1 uncharacterized protein (TIGR02001 family) [Sphingomonas jejuensis]